MGRTLATYRMRLRKHQFFFHKLVKATKTPIQPYDEAWVAAHQLATAGSMVPYAKTPVVAAFGMVTKLFCRIQQVRNRFSDSPLNTFGREHKKPKVKPKVISENTDSISKKSQERAPFQSLPLQVSSSSSEEVISYLEQWYIPYLPNEYRECFRKALSGVKSLTTTREFFTFPGDEIVVILHLLIYAAYQRIEDLEKKVNDLLNRFKQETKPKETETSEFHESKEQKSQALTSASRKKETKHLRRSGHYAPLDNWLGGDSYES